MSKLKMIQMVILGSQKIYWRVRAFVFYPQLFYWKFQGQGFHVKNRSDFKEYGWSLTSNSVNWGDLLIREIADAFFDMAAIRKEYAGAVFGGSVLSEHCFEHIQKNRSSRPVLAVSCGARNPRYSVEPPPNLEIHGVRGHRTAALLKDTVPTGDPGMLAPVIFGIEPKLSNEFRKLHVPHFSQQKNQIDSNFESLSTMFPFGKSSKSLVREINSSNFVLTGSLHAGICAFACGTPFAFSLADSSEDAFKFYDFAEFYGINIVFKEDYESAIRWYLGENTLHVDRVSKDFETYSSSLSKYAKYDLNAFRSKVEIHIKSRKSIHALKVKSLADFLKKK